MGQASRSEIVRCPACGANNRVREEKNRSGLEPVCGRCKTPLAAPAGPITVTDSSFAGDVERSPLPVLVDMWAEWCSPCKMLAPVMEGLANELGGRVRVGKLNVDENPATASRFGVRSIPTLLVFKDGHEVDRMVGLQSKSAILSRLQPLL